MVLLLYIHTIYSSNCHYAKLSERYMASIVSLISYTGWSTLNSLKANTLDRVSILLGLTFRTSTGSTLICKYEINAHCALAESENS